MYDMDRTKKSEVKERLTKEVMSGASIKNIIETIIINAYDEGFKAGQTTPDNRNINKIHDDVTETLQSWMNNNELYDGNLFDCIDMCFDDRAEENDTIEVIKVSDLGENFGDYDVEIHKAIIVT